MSLLDKLPGRFTAPKLTRGRMALAIAVAVAADGLQIALLPVAWTFAQEIIDVVAMVLTMGLLGFHLLLLPTLIIEFIPVVDAVPMWTGCVLVVIALRKRAEHAASANMSPVVDAAQPSEPPSQIGDRSPD